MRTFIAISLPQEIKTALVKLQKNLKTSGADVKWVEEQNIHLTLKFLGEIEEKIAEKICVILKETAKNLNPFSLRLESPGAFPRTDKPRVIWAGLGEDIQQLKNIVAELEKKLSEIDIPAEERAFASHITIGRLKSDKNREELVKGLIAAEEFFKNTNYEWRVNSIILFKSTLTPQGPIYDILKEATFNAN